MPIKSVFHIVSVNKKTFKSESLGGKYYDDIGDSSLNDEILSFIEQNQSEKTINEYIKDGLINIDNEYTKQQELIEKINKTDKSSNKSINKADLEKAFNIIGKEVESKYLLDELKNKKINMLFSNVDNKKIIDKCCENSTVKLSLIEMFLPIRVYVNDSIQLIDLDELINPKFLEELPIPLIKGQKEEVNTIIKEERSRSKERNKSKEKLNRERSVSVEKIPESKLVLKTKSIDLSLRSPKNSISNCSLSKDEKIENIGIDLEKLEISDKNNGYSSNDLKEFIKTIKEIDPNAGVVKTGNKKKLATSILSWLE